MRSKPFFLEFTEAGVTKGTSLNQLIQNLALSAKKLSQWAIAITIRR